MPATKAFAVRWVAPLGIFALLGTLLLSGRHELQPEQAKADPELVRSAVEGSAEELPDSLQLPGQGREVIGAAGLEVEIVASCRSFLPFRIGLLDPGTEKELDSRFVERFAEWTDLPRSPESPLSKVLVVVTGSGWRTVEQLAGAGDTVRIQVEPLSLLAGDVVDARTGGRVEAFHLRLEHRIEPPGSPPTTFAIHELDIEDAQGLFRVAGLPMDGDCLRLVCEAEGYLEGATDWLPIGAWIEDLTIGLESRASLSRLVGRVIGGSERVPVQGAEVHLVRPEASLTDVAGALGRVVIPPNLRLDFGVSAERPARAGAEEGMARTNADSVFEMTTRGTGEARLIAFHPDWGLAASATFLVASGEVTETPPVVFDAASTLVVRLTGGEGPSSLEVEVRGAGGPRSVTLTCPGTARFPGLAPGSYRVAVRDGFEPMEGLGRSLSKVLVEHWVQVAPEGDTLLDIDLRREAGTSIAGMISAPDEQSWQWALRRIDLSDLSTSGVDVLTDGSFTLENVAPGRHLLVGQGFPAEGARLAFVWRRLSVEESSSPPFLELHSLGRLEIHDSGTDVSVPGMLTIEPEDDALARLAAGRSEPIWFDASGRSLVYGLPPGHVAIEREGRKASLRLSGTSNVRADLGE